MSIWHSCNIIFLVNEQLSHRRRNKNVLQKKPGLKKTGLNENKVLQSETQLLVNEYSEGRSGVEVCVDSVRGWDILWFPWTGNQVCMKLNQHFCLSQQGNGPHHTHPLYSSLQTDFIWQWIEDKLNIICYIRNIIITLSRINKPFKSCIGNFSLLSKANFINLSIKPPTTKTNIHPTCQHSKCQDIQNYREMVKKQNPHKPHFVLHINYEIH